MQRAQCHSHVTRYSKLSGGRHAPLDPNASACVSVLATVRGVHLSVRPWLHTPTWLQLFGQASSNTEQFAPRKPKGLQEDRTPAGTALPVDARPPRCSNTARAHETKIPYQKNKTKETGPTACRPRENTHSQATIPYRTEKPQRPDRRVIDLR